MTAKDLLKGCEVFAGLGDADLERVASSALEKTFDAGATICQEGDSAVELLVLREGRAAIQMMLPRELGQIGRRITVDVVGRNEVLGWSAIVEPYNYAFSAVCLQNVKAVSISGAKLRMLLEEDRNIGYQVLKGLMRVVASRLNETRHVLASERLLAV